MSAVVMMLHLVFVDGAVLNCRLCASRGVAPNVVILSDAPAIDTLHDHLGAPPVRLRWMSRLLECATYRWYNTLTSARGGLPDKVALDGTHALSGRRG